MIVDIFKAWRQARTSCGERCRDIEHAIDHYRDEAGEKDALGFVAQVERAHEQIATHPETGSTRYAHELDIPGLRFWPLKRYPYLVIYMNSDNHIDVWRVLHAERDIPGWMREGEG